MIDIENKIENTQVALNNVYSVIKVLRSYDSLSELTDSIPNIDNAQLQVTLAFVVASFYYGLDSADHPIKHELKRIKEAMKKVFAVANGELESLAEDVKQPRVDKEVVSRIVNFYVNQSNNSKVQDDVWGNKIFTPESIPVLNLPSVNIEPKNQEKSLKNVEDDLIIEDDPQSLPVDKVESKVLTPGDITGNEALYSYNLAGDKQNVKTDKHSATGDKQSSATVDKQSSATGDKQSSATGDKQSSATGDKQSSATGDKQSSATGDKQSSATGDKQVDGTGDKQVDASKDVKPCLEEVPQLRFHEKVQKQVQAILDGNRKKNKSNYQVEENLIIKELDNSDLELTKKSSKAWRRFPEKNFETKVVVEKISERQDKRTVDVKRSAAVVVDSDSSSSDDEPVRIPNRGEIFNKITQYSSSDSDVELHEVKPVYELPAIPKILSRKRKRKQISGVPIVATSADGSSDGSETKKTCAVKFQKKKENEQPARKKAVTRSLKIKSDFSVSDQLQPKSRKAYYNKRLRHICDLARRSQFLNSVRQTSQPPRRRRPQENFSKTLKKTINNKIIKKKVTAKPSAKVGNFNNRSKLLRILFANIKLLQRKCDMIEEQVQKLQRKK